MKHFDDILKSKLENASIETSPSESMWNNIQTELSPTPSSGNKFKQQLWSGIAATTLIGTIMITASNDFSEKSSSESFHKSVEVSQPFNLIDDSDAEPEKLNLNISNHVEHIPQESHEIPLKTVTVNPKPNLIANGEEVNVKTKDTKLAHNGNQDVKIADTEDSETNDSTVDELSTIDFKAAGIQCENSEITFKTKNEHKVPGEVQWIFDSVHLRDGEETSFSFEEAGKHHVHMIFRAESGEIINIKKEFTVHSIPTIEIDIIESDKLETFSREVNITGQPSTNTYQWYVDGKYLGKSDTIQAFLKPGWHEFAVKAINEFGCTNKYNKSQLIEDGLLIYIPSAFTPNNDNLNDTWFPQNLEHVQDFHLKIVRKADLSVVFETNTMKEWNGQLPNGNMPRAGEQFFVQIIATDKRGDVQQFEEVLTIPSSR